MDKEDRKHLETALGIGAAGAAGSYGLGKALEKYMGKVRTRPMGSVASGLVSGIAGAAVGTPVSLAGALTTAVNPAAGIPLYIGGQLLGLGTTLGTAYKLGKRVEAKNKQTKALLALDNLLHGKMLSQRVAKHMEHPIWKMLGEIRPFPTIQQMLESHAARKAIKRTGPLVDAAVKTLKKRLPLAILLAAGAVPGYKALKKHFGQDDEPKLLTE